MRISRDPRRAHAAPAPDRLAAVLFGKSMRAILALLFGRPDRRFYLREIARVAGVPPSSLQRDLVALTGAGVLARTVEGRQVYFQANPGCPIFGELQALAAKTFGVAGVLKGVLAPHASRIRFAFLFGSVAKGSAAAASDVDLLWVGELLPSELVLALAEAEKRLARRISVIAYSEDEFAELAKEQSHFLESVLKGPVVWLIGGRQALDDLARVKTRKPRARKAAQR
jgi:predicted nucleotidyltransferase